MHGQTSLWNNILAGVPKGSALGFLMFLIRINDLPKGVTWICKIFANYSSLFSKIENNDLYTVQMNEGLKTMSNWAYQRKILFNADPNIHTIEVCFSQKHKKVNYSSLFFNGDKVQSVSSQKPFKLVLDF